MNKKLKILPKELKLKIFILKIQNIKDLHSEDIPSGQNVAD